MGASDLHQLTLRSGDVAGAFAWWRDAGVDLDFADTPTDWLPAETVPGRAVAAAAMRLPEAPLPEPAVPLGGAPQGWPADLASFAEWWLNDPALDDGQVRDRVAPRGSAGAPLMVIVAQPEPGDGALLLSGPEGRLLDAILAAAGITGEDCYRAAVLPRHTPLPDWAGLSARGIGALLAHHVRLVAPQRIIAFGTHILPLLDHSLTQTAQNLPAFNHEGGPIPLLGTRELAALLARPAWKAAFWRNWLDWTGTASA